MKKKSVLISLLAGICIIISLISTLIANNFEDLLNTKLPSIVYIIVYILIIIILLIFNKFEILNCSGVFLVFFTFFLGIGPIILDIKNYVYFFNSYVVILTSLSMFLLGSISFIWYAKKNNRIIKKKLNKIDPNKQKKTAISLLIFSIFFWIRFIVQNYKILMADMENGRVIAIQGNGKVIYFIYLSMIATWILYYGYLKYKNIKKIYIIIIISIVSFMLFTIGFRARIAELFIVILLLNNYKQKINIKKIFLYGVIGVIAIVFLYYIRIYVSGLQSKSFLSLIENILIVGNINLNYIFRAFPNYIEFQKGYTYLINFLMLKPGPDLDFTLWLKQVLNLSFDGAGLTPTIIGELYINFGYLGIYLGMYIIGVLCKLIDKNEISTENSIVNSMIILYLCRSVTGGITNNLLLFLWLFVVYIFSKKLYSVKVI